MYCGHYDIVNIMEHCFIIVQSIRFMLDLHKYFFSDERWYNHGELFRRPKIFNKQPWKINNVRGFFKVKR